MSQRKLKKIRKEVEVLKNIENRQDVLGKVGLRVALKKIIKENWMYLLGLTVMVVIIYWNGLAGGFVSDDYASITQNPQVGDFWHMFGNSATFSNYLVYKLVGVGSPVGYHVFSLLLYIVFCWLAFLVLETIFENKWLIKVTMAIFAVHPIHVEAVSWISGRIYLILGIYMMVAFLCFIFFVKNNKPKYLLVSIGAFALAFITDKPRPFAILLIMVIYLLYVGINRVRINWTRFIAGMAVLTVLFVIFAVPYIKFRIGVVNSGYNTSESIFYNPFFQYPTGISKYLQLLTVPLDLTLYHTMYTIPAWLNWTILINYFVLIVYFFFKDKRYFFALTFVIAAILPSIMPVKVSWLVAERYMFLGSLGFCLFLGLLLVDLRKRINVLSYVLLAIIAVVFGYRTILRNYDWNTNHLLWVNTCLVSPNSHNAWNNIGDDYDKLNDPANAIKGFTQSTIVKPNYADAYHNRANIFFKTGRLDLARESYSTALSFSPNLYQTYLSLTQIDLMEGKNDLALEHSQVALKLQPENPQAAYVAGVVYAQIGKAIEAENIFEDILKRIPEYQPAKQALQQLKTLMVTQNEKKN